VRGGCIIHKTSGGKSTASTPNSRENIKKGSSNAFLRETKTLRKGEGFGVVGLDGGRLDWPIISWETKVVETLGGQGGSYRRGRKWKGGRGRGICEARGLRQRRLNGETSFGEGLECNDRLSGRNKGNLRANNGQCHIP